MLKMVASIEKMKIEKEIRDLDVLIADAIERNKEESKRVDEQIIKNKTYNKAKEAKYLQQYAKRQAEHKAMKEHMKMRDKNIDLYKPF